MLRENGNDLLAFLAVAREGSFTRAAAQLGLSQSSLSHTVKALEKRLGLRLLTRTTRKVVPTAAGERVLQRIGPHVRQIEEELSALLDMRDRPAGRFRLTATDYAMETLIWPKLRGVLARHPDIRVEIDNDYGLTDIVSERYDAGVRLGEQVAEGMIAVRIGPDFRLVAAAAPGYFAEHGVPREPQDLTRHRCINLRLPTHDGLYAWEFERDGRDIRVRVDGQLAFNATGPIIQAALDGFGLCLVPEDLVSGHVAAGRLQLALEDWCQPFTGHHLYYPDRRQSSAAFSIIVEALRYRDEGAG